MRTVQIPVGSGARDVVHGDLTVPDAARGIVVFAHGSGSSRHSPRNRMVAGSLSDRGHATLLMDLLTQPEDEVDSVTREHRFDIPLLAERLQAAMAWLARDDQVASKPLGLFGASTGAAAALIAAARQPQVVRAVVSRGGRPDMAGDDLARVKAPTLLIVGGNDPQVLTLNREAAQRLAGPHTLSIVQGATHLFGEPGKLEQVAHLAGNWFDEHLKD